MRVIERERKEFNVEEKTLNQFLTERGSEALPYDVPGYVIEDENKHKTWIDSTLFRRRYAVVDNYVERMIVEENELRDKIAKLSVFTQGDTFKNLPDNSKNLMVEQLECMSRYARILRQRICMEVNGKATQD